MKIFPAIIIFVLCSVSVLTQTSERDKGIDFYNQGDNEKAVEVLQKVVGADQTDENAYLYLGMSLAKLKKTSSGAKALNKADKLHKKNNGNSSSEGQNSVRITAKPRAEYTDTARMNQVQGTIKIAVDFGADGQIKTTFAFQTLPDGLTENCIKAVNKIKFEPAMKDGKPVSSIRIISYSFTIY